MNFHTVKRQKLAFRTSNVASTCHHERIWMRRIAVVDCFLANLHTKQRLVKSMILIITTFDHQHVKENPDSSNCMLDIQILPSRLRRRRVRPYFLEDEWCPIIFASLPIFCFFLLGSNHLFHFFTIVSPLFFLFFTLISPPRISLQKNALPLKKKNTKSLLPSSTWSTFCTIHAPWLHTWPCRFCRDEQFQKQADHLSNKKKKREREREIKHETFHKASRKPGFGSHNKEQIDNRTLEMVKAGDHWSFKMSKQMLPLLLMLGW